MCVSCRRERALCQKGQKMKGEFDQGDERLDGEWKSFQTDEIAKMEQVQGYKKKKKSQRHDEAQDFVTSLRRNFLLQIVLL